MTYLKIGGVDLSHLVNELKVDAIGNYSAQTNANGDTVVDYINTKYTITVGFIPMEQSDLGPLLALITPGQSLSVSYLDPANGAMKTISCILPAQKIDYYTIQVNRVLYKTFTITLQQL